MKPKTYRWLFLILWSVVVGIAVAVIMAWIAIRAVNPLTYITGVFYIAVPAAFVFLLQKHYRRDS